MEMRHQHDRDVEIIRCQFLDRKQTKPTSERVTLQRDSHSSNTMRSASYKKSSRPLNVNPLNRVITVDVLKRTVLVEPKVTMEELFLALIPYGFIVPVMPEFKGITVGGAIMGAALESSSHRWGQFNDICVSCDLIIGDGTLVHATPTEHADLFYGLSGSYGSLGLLVLAELTLIPAPKSIHLTYHRLGSVSETIECLAALHRLSHPPDFLESVIFNANNAVIIEGRFEEAPRPCTLSMTPSSSVWFYQQVKKQSDCLKFHGISDDEVALNDYLFRYDRGAFWMGAYALHPSLLMRFILEGLLLPKRFHHDFGAMSRKKYTQLKYPGLLFRSLTASIMPSQQLYALLHRGSEDWFEKNFVIQDFYIPEKNTTSFIENTLTSHGITPLWICPIKPTQTPQFLAPHYQPPHCKTKDSLLFDVGVYGMPTSDDSIETITIGLEKETKKLDGRKMLYSHSYYTKEEFWQIYPEETYRALRRAYFAEDVWLSIESKVLNNLHKKA